MTQVALMCAAIQLLKFYERHLCLEYTLQKQYSAVRKCLNDEEAIG